MVHLGVSLRTRLTLWYGALLALTLLAFSTFLYFTLQQQLASSMDTRLGVRADQIRREVGPSIGNLLQPEDVAPGKLESTLGEFVEPGIYVQLLNQKGAVIAAPPNLVGGELPVPPVSRQAIAEDRRIYITLPVGAGDAPVRLLTDPIHQAGTNDIVGAVQVAESLTPFENTMSAMARLVLSAGAAALLLAVVVGWLLTRAALSPVFRITDTARHIAATGDYRQRLHVTPPRFGHGDELFFLAATFNDMIARLEHMLESQRRLLADTSHELRNPITIIRGNLALLRRENVPPAMRHEAVVEAEEEAARMGRLVGDLLLLARADAGEQPSLQREQVDLAELATEVVERARPQADHRRLSLTIEGRSVVLGDRDRLKQLIANLVENAVRYTPQNGRIDVAVTGPPNAAVQQAGRSVRSRNARARHDPTDMALLTIADSGIGISPTDLPHVFERFYRADKARSRAHGGTGLGLSIAQYIVQAHGGSIQAASEGSNRGSTFSVRLPLLASVAPGKPSALPQHSAPVAASR
ncbi:MAG TPA: HAMP domain-containing sensor histidine kinase [Chloroflexota bacterium]|nr:HAMP domain-containing sensor histidine kinase [Chloroflexota bacterium]